MEGSNRGNSNPLNKWKKGKKWANAKQLRMRHTRTIIAKAWELFDGGIPYLVLDQYASKGGIHTPDIVYVKDGKMVAFEAETSHGNKFHPLTAKGRYERMYRRRGILLDFVAVDGEINAKRTK